MNAICLITFIPNNIWCDFLNLFNKYKIFIVVDNNNFDLYEFKNNYKNINFIQITDEKCKLNGYIDTNFTLNKLISGWDKALYYFGVENKNLSLLALNANLARTVSFFAISVPYIHSSVSMKRWC